MNRSTACVLLGLGLALLFGCDDMADQPKQKVYAPQVGPAAVPSNTVEFQEQPAQPPSVTLALIDRGQDRFRIYCAPCHSELGDGNGMIVQRGFPSPPSYHIARLREAPVQHFYDVITQGHGAMYSFANRVQPADRWAIAAYIRALQRSQNATLTDVAPDQRGRIAMTRDRLEVGAWIVGGVGLLGCAIGGARGAGSISARLAGGGYGLDRLAAWAAIALILIHALIGGRWGWAIRPQLVAGIVTLPLVLPALVPILFVLHALYPWMHADVAASLDNRFYLNASFFYRRGIVYLIVWLGLGALVLRALRQVNPEPILYRIAPPGLILLALTVTFAAFDYTLSMEPRFKSSVYGLLVGTEGVLLALSVAVMAVMLGGSVEPERERGDRRSGQADARPAGVLGLSGLHAAADHLAIRLAARSRLVCSSDRGGWGIVAAVVAGLHFVLPFFALLWPQMQRSRRVMGWCGNAAGGNRGAARVVDRRPRSRSVALPAGR